MKIGDLYPSYVHQILNVFGLPQDVSSFASVKFRMRRADASIDTIFTSAVFTTDGSDGLVQYDFTAGDVATLTPGVYQAWFHFYDELGNRETAPEEGCINIVLEAEPGAP